MTTNEALRGRVYDAIRALNATAARLMAARNQVFDMSRGLQRIDPNRPDAIDCAAVADVASLATTLREEADRLDALPSSLKA